MKYLTILCALIFSITLFAKTVPNEFKVVVTDKGYEPSTLKVQAGKPITLKITRKTDSTCARDITIPSQKISVKLPMDKEVVVKVDSLQKGEIKFGCSMDMMVGGVILAE